MRWTPFFTLALFGANLMGGSPCAWADDKLPPTAMPRDYKGPRPKPRSAAEVEAVLAGAVKPEKLRPIRVVLVAGKKDHGKGEHDYPAWQAAWAALFKLADGVQVATKQVELTDGSRSGELIITECKFPATIAESRFRKP